MNTSYGVTLGGYYTDEGEATVSGYSFVFSGSTNAAGFDILGDNTVAVADANSEFTATVDTGKPTAGANTEIVDNGNNNYTFKYTDSSSSSSSSSGEASSSSSGETSSSSSGEASSSGTDTSSSATVTAEAAAETLVGAADNGDSNRVKAPSGSGISIAGVSAVTDATAISKFKELATEVQTATSNGALKMFNFEINATGSGTLSLSVGTEYAGKVAVVGHIHNGTLTVQQCIVDTEGNISPSFADFSPISVIVTNKTSLISSIATTEKTVTSSSAAAASTTTTSSSTATKTTSTTTKTSAPKTGNAEYMVYIMLLAAACATLLAIAKKNER